MNQLTINHTSALRNYHDRIYQPSALVSESLVEEIETFVLTHKHHWSSSDLPVLISLASRLTQITGNDSSINCTVSSALALHDTPAVAKARGALYTLLSKILGRSKAAFGHCTFCAEMNLLWRDCESRALLASHEGRAILKKIAQELSQVNDEAAVQLMGEIEAALIKYPKTSLKLSQSAYENFQESLLLLIEEQTQKKLKEIEDPTLEQALDTCEAQLDQKLADLDQETNECIELLGDCFSFAAATDAAFTSLNIEAQKFLFELGSEMHATVVEKFPFLKERQYYPNLMEKLRRRLYTMELNWNPFVYLNDDVLLTIASYLPSLDFQRWCVSHRFTHDYFENALFCENITSCTSSDEYAAALGYQNSYLKQMCKGSRIAWACQMGPRVKGLSLRNCDLEKVDLDQLLEKCPNLVAIDLRGAKIKNLPFNILQLKFLALSRGLFDFSDSTFSALESLGFLSTREEKTDSGKPLNERLKETLLKNRQDLREQRFELFIRPPSKESQGSALIVAMDQTCFNPIPLLYPSLERLILVGDWSFPKLNIFFSQLKKCCPNLKYLDLSRTTGALPRLFHLDLAWIKKLEFPESQAIDLKGFFSHLRMCGQVLVNESCDNRYNFSRCSDVQIRMYYVWERADFVPFNTLKLENLEVLTNKQFLVLNQVYPRLEELIICEKYSNVKAPQSIWRLISAATRVELLHEKVFSSLQNELENLGFLKKVIEQKQNTWERIPPKIVWVNPQGYFTLKGSLKRFDEILTMSPKSAPTKIGLPFLDIPRSSEEGIDLKQLNDLLQNHGIEALQIDRIEIGGQYIKKLPSHLPVVTQVITPEVELKSLPEGIELPDIAPILQSQKVERLHFSILCCPLSENHLLKDLIDNCEQFPDLVEVRIEGPRNGKVPEAWILKGWFPSIHGNVLKFSRHPTDVTLSTEMVEILTEQALKKLLSCPQLQSIDLTGQPVSEQFATKLLDLPLKQLIVSPDLEGKIFFKKMLSQIEPGLLLKYSWRIEYLQINPVQGRKLILSDDDILAMVRKYPSLKYLHLENVDLSQITSRGIKALLKLSLNEVTLGSSSLLLVNVLLSLSTLRSLVLHTEKLSDLNLDRFSLRIFSTNYRELTIRVTKFHPICLSLLKHPEVANMEFEKTTEFSVIEKKAVVELGYKLIERRTDFLASRVNQRSYPSYIGRTSKNSSFILQEGELKEAALVWFSFYYPSIQSLVCSGKDLSDSGLLLLPSMKSLTLKSTPAVTFNGLIAYLKNAPSLQTLQINMKISSEQVLQLEALGWKMKMMNRLYQEFERDNSMQKSMNKSSRVKSKNVN